MSIVRRKRSCPCVPPGARSWKQVRASPVYHAAQAALAADRQEDLARLLPQILAAIEVVQPASTLFFPVSPSSGQRRPGASPFLSARQCADHIAEMLAAGVLAEETGSEWWERDWPCIVCADDPEALDTPIALRLERPDCGAAVFAMNDEPTFRIFTRRLRAPMVGRPGERGHGRVVASVRGLVSGVSRRLAAGVGRDVVCGCTGGE